MHAAWWLLTLAVLALAHPAMAAEIHSNGRGGGKWDDPATWHSGVVPAADDTVVIAMRDTQAAVAVGLMGIGVVLVGSSAYFALTE